MFYKQMGIPDEGITLRSSVGSLCAGGARTGHLFALLLMHT